jgi:hypothetical protein
MALIKPNVLNWYRLLLAYVELLLILYYLIRLHLFIRLIPNMNEVRGYRQIGHADVGLHRGNLTVSQNLAFCIGNLKHERKRLLVV